MIAGTQVSDPSYLDIACASALPDAFFIAPQIDPTSMPVVLCLGLMAAGGLLVMASGLVGLALFCARVACRLERSACP